MLDYRGGKLVLAPMVRIGELPTRLLSLKYGADLVWGPELIDKKMIQCRRVWNEKLKTVDFLEPNNKVAFRTCPELEKDKLVFQMGTASADLAVKAGNIVAKDVAAIDVNSGCPKHFSIQGGMGAALLKKPDTLVEILTSLVEQVGKPNNISISVKIRLLDDPEDTYALVRKLVNTGIDCLTLHCRTAPMRPREPAIRDALAKVVEICHSAGIACFVNGDVDGRWQLDELQKKYNVDGGMIARAAETNASCFAAKQPGDLQPSAKVAKEFMEYAKQFDNHFSNSKYCLARVIPGKHPIYQKIQQSKNSEQLEQAVDEIETAAAAAAANNNKRKSDQLEQHQNANKRPKELKA